MEQGLDLKKEGLINRNKLIKFKFNGKKGLIMRTL